jgi:hypothetical protein
MAGMLSRRADASERVAPVRELFAHVAGERRLYEALIAAGRLHDFLDLARGHFARAIERRLAELPRASGIEGGQRAALGHAHAGALLSLMTWWLDRGAPGSPAEMDDLFHRLVWTGVAAAER